MWSLWHKTQIGKPKARALRLQGMLRSVWWHSGTICKNERLSQSLRAPLKRQHTSKAVRHGVGRGMPRRYGRSEGVACRALSSLMSLLLVPRSPDSDGSRKTPLDTTHTRGEQPVCSNTCLLCSDDTSWNTGTHCSANFTKNCRSFSLLLSRCGSALPLSEQNIFLC